MVKDGNGWVESHNVTFSKKITAGGILEHDLSAGQSTTSGNPIKSEWAPYQSKILLLGEDISADNLGNTANPEKIASPDNLKFSETFRTLFIGEDSGNHPNNFLWAYNVETKANPVRLLSTPFGAESTGLHAVDSINGWTYIMSNFQHPGDMKDIGGLKAATQANYNGGFSASVGYITADPIAPSISKKATETKKAS